DDGLCLECGRFSTRHRDDVDHAARRVPPEGGRVRADHLEPGGRGEVELVERRAAVGLRFGEAIDENADAARRPGVRPISGTASAEAADHESDVARAVSRLRDDSGNAVEGVIETEPAHGSQLLRPDLRNREGRREDPRWRASGGDGHAGKGLCRVAGVWSLSESFGPQQGGYEQMREK